MPEPQTPLSERPWEAVERMISVDAALETALAAVRPLDPVAVPLLDALGLVLAEDVVAGIDVPPFRNSAMDGYAVRAADTDGATFDAPVRLRLAGSVAAGESATVAVGPGEAIRIMTGAPMPEGADAVVRFEETDETAYGPDRNQRDARADVGIARPARPWDNVRPAGEDITRGSTVLRAGCVLRAPELGVLASIDRTTVLVRRRPVVAVLSTGDEVAAPGSAARPEQIRDSNATTLAAMVRQAGGEPVLLGIAPDRQDALSGYLARARAADLILTSGGVSLGDYDVVKDVLRAEGEIAIWQVRMKPGKPLAFGRIGDAPLLGLPGNPVAAAVSFVQFGRPMIKRMLGRDDLLPPCIQAAAPDVFDNRGHRRHYVRVRVAWEPPVGWVARAAGEQGAGMLTSLAAANGLLVIPEEIEHTSPGMMLTVQMLDWDNGGNVAAGPGAAWSGK
jgi:molybdopterin molybdotransferase